MRISILALVACGTPAGDGLATSAVAAPRAAAPAGDGLADPIATVGGDPISLADVEKAAAPGLIAARNQMYDARRAALDEIVTEKLLDREAKARNVARDALLKSEVDDKLTALTDADVAAFYEQNKNQMRGADLESVRPRIQEFLTQQRQGERMMAFLEELKQKHAVTDLLTQPRIQVDAGNAPRKGTAAAPVQIVEFSDFQCPYCTRGRDTVNEIVAKYGDKVSVAFRHFPLPFHADAHKASQAAECAKEEGKFWEFHDALFDHQQALGLSDLVRYAKDLGIDAKPFEDCVVSGRHAARVDKDIEDGKAVGMSGTPGFYINGIMVQGALPIEEFSKIIDKELGQAGATR